MKLPRLLTFKLRFGHSFLLMVLVTYSGETDTSGLLRDSKILSGLIPGLFCSTKHLYIFSCLLHSCFCMILY
ncbi:unnamed protein product, partial [Lactuca virosa]